jgi:hypothetical protein
MKIKHAISALLLATILIGGLQVSAQAENIATIYPPAGQSFAEAAPLIPGYNAPYPVIAVALAADDAPAAAGPVQSYASTAAGSFAATAPTIPGYNAAYPILAVVVTQD